MQEMFDTILKGIRMQGGPSMARERCAYRGADGRRCAIGLLIMDGDYTTDIEGLGVASLFNRGYFSDLKKEAKKFLADMQLLHDDVAARTFEDGDKAFLKEWEQRMCKYAEEHGLKWAE